MKCRLSVQGKHIVATIGNKRHRFADLITCLNYLGEKGYQVVKMTCPDGPDGPLTIILEDGSPKKWRFSTATIKGNMVIAINGDNVPNPIRPEVRKDLFVGWKLAAEVSCDGTYGNSLAIYKQEIQEL